MKKLIQICSLLSLVVVFSVVSAKAQTVQRFKADIPFAFSIGGKSYEAGTYVMKLSNTPTGKVMTLINDQNHVLQLFYAMERGDAPTKSSFLRFVRTDDNRLSLAKLLTPEKSFSIPGAGSKSKSAKNSGSASSDAQTVSIQLN